MAQIRPRQGVEQRSSARHCVTSEPGPPPECAFFGCCSLHVPPAGTCPAAGAASQPASSPALSAGGPGVSWLEQATRFPELGFQPPPSQQKLLKTDILTHAPGKAELRWDAGMPESPPRALLRPTPAFPLQPAAPPPPCTRLCVCFNGPVSLVCQHMAPRGQASSRGRCL